MDTPGTCFSSGGTRNCWREALHPLVEHGKTPWITLIGNHDVGRDVRGRDLMDFDRSFPLSRSEHGDEALFPDESTYVVTVRHPGGAEAFRIWMLQDSGQVAWYRRRTRELNAGRTSPLPAIAFTHVPLQEHLDVWNHGETNGTGVEPGCCWDTNTHLYSAMRRHGDVMLVSCGHDHFNDYIGDHHGILMAYGRKTGYGGFQPKNQSCGARVFDVSSNAESGGFSFRTWIREASGNDVHRSEPGIWKS
jgi:hypothetical protein